LTKNQKILKNPATTKTDSPRVRELKHKARNYSIKDGMFASAKTSLGYNYISPLAIAINASNSIVAMLSAVTGILGPLSQIFGSRLIEKYNRKKILAKAVLAEVLMWIPFLTIALLFYFNILTEILPLALLLIFSLYTIVNNLGHPAWFSWMGDIVDEKYRGRWFAKRNLLLGFVSIIVGITSAIFLDFTKEKNLTMFGFTALFIIALISRTISLRSIKKQYEPKIKLKKGYYFSFLDFLLAPKDNFKTFSIYRFFLNIACSISTPLLAVYLLRFLEFEYTAYMIITFAPTVFSLIVLELWGKFADKYGNYKILAISSIFIPLLPILWILSPNIIYLILIPSFVSGISWAGFNLATSNFIYDNISQQKRSLAVSYFNMLAGIGTFIGAGIGAILIKYLTIDITAPIIAIFIFGSLMRMIVVFFIIPQINEIKETEKFEGGRTLKNLILTEAKPTLIEEAHQIMSIKKYIHVKE
ncbi:MAG: MFS transporter, partial [Candidatus Pacearchaeota archaeon]|nr:MFS transporter [Candidatus Pacearchaeota archaeon]